MGNINTQYNHFCVANTIAGGKFKTFCQKRKKQFAESPSKVMNSKKAVTKKSCKVKE
jgi:hypothetical protein